MENKLTENIIDQMKEAQIKLGYVKETVRLYYPVESLNALAGTAAQNADELLELLEGNPVFTDTVLGRLRFAVHEGRIEVSVPPEGTVYVHNEIPAPAFLTDIIELFGSHHCCTLQDIRAVFERYSKDYLCEKMPEEMDFDYVFHFKEDGIDPYYYCIKEEMGHTIYHRFTKEDYAALTASSPEADR